MTKPQQIQQRINEIIEPDVEKRLTFGCEIIYYGNVFKIDFVVNKRVYRSKIEGYILLDKCIVLGKQPNLEMLLLAFVKITTYEIVYQYDKRFISFILTLPLKGQFDWHLNQSLENQPEETINTICKILNLERWKKNLYRMRLP